MTTRAKDMVREDSKQIQDDPEVLAYAFMRTLNKNGHTYSTMSPFYKGAGCSVKNMAEINAMIASKEAIAFVHATEKGGLVKILASRTSSRGDDALEIL